MCLRLEVGKVGEAIQINLLLGSDGIDHADGLEASRRRRGVKFSTGRLFGKLLL